MERRLEFFRRDLVYRAQRNGFPRTSLQLLFCLFCLLTPGLAAMAQDSVPPPPPESSAPGQPAAPSTPGIPADSDQTRQNQAPLDQAGEESAAQEQAPQSTVRAVRLSDVEGQVLVYQGDQLAFPQAEPNMPAVEGMRFVTHDNGRLEIEFEDGSVARVTPNSSIRLSRLQRMADGSTVTWIDALSGLSYYELNGRAGQYTVLFGQEKASPPDSAVFRVGLDTDPMELAVMHGAVHVDDGGGVSVDIHPNQTFQADAHSEGQFTVAQSVSADSWDQWNSDRDQALADLESTETTARASTGEPDDPAWNDLDSYGSWYNMPGYGQVWSPNGVGQDWDPFGSGYWGYYPSFGYTWISGYPWGWWPYHCGAWDFIGSFGWVWAPGNCGWGAYGAGWFPYAGIWRVPQGYLPPPRPHGTGTGPGFHPQPLVAVNRGPQYGAPFRFGPGARSEPRPLTVDGQTIQPLRGDIHPQSKGPTGETFTNSLVRTHPELPASILDRHSSPEMGPGALPGAALRRFPPPMERRPGTTDPARPAVPVRPGGGGAAPHTPPGGTHSTGGGVHPDSGASEHH
jgi:hypothetical protein